MTGGWGVVYGAGVVINEVQSSNDATCYDEDGTSSDWLELYNGGNAEVSLAGWGLSDKPSKPFKWVFPEGTTIAPRGHLLVFASGKDRAQFVREPDSVPGLCVWLRGDDALADYGNNGKVTKWRDVSGLGNNATNATYRPTVVANAVNGHAAVKFVHSSGQMLYLPVKNFRGLASLSNATVYAVCKWSGTSTTVGVFGQYSSSDATGNAHFEMQSGGVLRWRVADVDLKTASGSVAANAWTVLSGHTDMARETPRVALYQDGRLLMQKEAAIGKTSFAKTEHLFIGNSCQLPGVSGNRTFDGQIAEVAIFDHALTAEERTGIDAYFADKYQGGLSGLHANFSLSGDGETLTLTQPDGTSSDTVTFGRLPCDSSWGRVTDGAQTWGHFATPTPSAANAGTTYSAPLAPVEFNPPRGVYSSALAVTLSHPDPDASIYYTLDCTEPSSTNGIRYTGTPIVVNQSAFIRATAVKSGTLPCRNIATHSYLFLADAAVNPGIPTGFPSTWTTGSSSSKAVYGVSANVVQTDADRRKLVSAISSTPILSVVMPDADLFSAASGVYTHPTTAGYEKTASCEWIGTNGLGRVQLDAGLRAQGAASRNFGSQPKKSFRLCFRGRYGAGSLTEPVLDAGGCDLADFNTLILRAEYNNSWTHSDATQRTRGSHVRDQFMRDLFREMGQPGAAGTEVHLYLNGHYWGLYNLTERPDAAFGVTYFGGLKYEWDVIKSGAEVRDGDATAWNAMYAASKGTLSSVAGYAALTNCLDVVNFADYMLLNHWGGNQDWPHNNWVAMRRRAEGERFRFCVWDAERTLEYVSDNRLSANNEHPGAIHSRLLASSEYKALYAVRARRHLHPRHGLLASTNAIARWERMCAAVAPSVFGEAARWGSYRQEAGNTSVVYNESTWETERKRVRDAYLPARSTNFIVQLTKAGLWKNYDEEAVFLPDDKANWDNDDNWSTSVYPDLPGARALVLAPSTNGVDAAKGWRNLRLKNHNVVVGTLTFENGSFTNRVTNKDDVVPGADYGVVFDGNGATAMLAVRDVAGGGCTVFDNDYPTRLVTDLRVVVDNPEGSSEYGALRLQQVWEGPGAFIKEGRGRCSLTGAGKNWTGGTRVKAGLLSATAKSFPQGIVVLEPGARFLVVGAKRSEISNWRSRFELDDTSLAAPAQLHLWVRSTNEGLLFSALTANPGTIIFFRGTKTIDGN